MVSLNDLIVAIDYSRSFKYIGLVAAKEHVIKTANFLNKTSWIKHIADLPKREKTVYLHRLPDRLAKVTKYLSRIRLFRNTKTCSEFVKILNPAVVIVDPKLNPHIDYPRKVLEDRVKRRHEKILALLADNIAYYSYWVIEVRRKPGELNRILK